ncbi:putative adenylyltransferase/sulfurtransferase MoeZ [Aquisphaera giovannonii]|uniref:Putative adenylyltransferase/sulfurtransferase MoeZ n=1 Tax=Aquisphaera giovannonii TaxID=406548 RepID=A0A5B9W1X2_9BACT|nr:ThiF family adenylyltransferase [Aquisphaera giovannonii]QEH34191.1 putative adenylyltransferase/sulfurtransferase MoeZ [Aquisphaera giovannonii]
MSDILRISGGSDEDDRFSRFRLIGWWDQARLAAAKVLVIGAGALGNEIVKNLALLGVGRVVVADLDRVENSNLSRSVLFRESDRGRAKAEVAAGRAADIYPGIRARPFVGNVVYDLGQGIYRWADVILGGLDNREARVAINHAAARAGKIWIDGAIERLDGVARVFDPAVGPCYECTMGVNDWKMLEARRSCALLSRGEMELGKVPTTPTTASIVAGIQVQEAVKLLHGLEVLSGQGYVFDGTHHQSYVVSYTRKEDCPSHEPYEAVEELAEGAGTVLLGDLLERARSDLGAGAVLELSRDLLKSLTCDRCGTTESRFGSLGRVTEAEGRCPGCGLARTPAFFHAIDGEDPALLGLTPAAIGVPPWDVVTGRAGWRQRHYELAADRGTVLGPLADAS